MDATAGDAVSGSDLAGQEKREEQQEERRIRQGLLKELAALAACTGPADLSAGNNAGSTGSSWRERSRLGKSYASLRYDASLLKRRVSVYWGGDDVFYNGEVISLVLTRRIAIGASRRSQAAHASLRAACPAPPQVCGALKRWPFPKLR